MTDTVALGFPFAVDSTGLVHASTGDDAIRARIIQVLFTAPGERVNLPEFGCGLFNLVFEPNSELLAATMEFTVRQALDRWLASDLRVDGVAITSAEEQITVEIAYTLRRDLTRQSLRLHYR
jgi:uncharacterized protein